MGLTETSWRSPCPRQDDDIMAFEGGHSKSCARTCVDDSVKFMSMAQLLVGLAALTLAAKMMYSDDFFNSGDWSNVSRSWFLYSACLYGSALFLCGFFGLFGTTICRGLCIDLHAFLTIILLALEGAVVAVYACDPSALDVIADKDPTGSMHGVLEWTSKNWIGAVAIVSTVCAIQILSFLVAWMVRMCCGAHALSSPDGNPFGDYEHDTESNYTYEPLPRKEQAHDFHFSAYSPEATNGTANQGAPSSGLEPTWVTPKV